MNTKSETPRKPRLKEGQHSVYATIDDYNYVALDATADGRPLNAWLSRMIAKVTIAKLASLYLETE